MQLPAAPSRQLPILRLRLGADLASMTSTFGPSAFSRRGCQRYMVFRCPQVWPMVGDWRHGAFRVVAELRGFASVTTKSRELSPIADMPSPTRTRALIAPGDEARDPRPQLVTPQPSRSCNVGPDRQVPLAVPPLRRPSTPPPDSKLGEARMISGEGNGAPTAIDVGPTWTKR